MLKNYDMSVVYYPSKAHIVADTLSRMTIASVSPLDKAKSDLAREVHRLDILG